MSQDGRHETFPLYRKLAFASGHFLNVLGISMWFPYNVSFFEKVLGIPPKSTGTIILVAQIAGAISNPFVGMWSDQTRITYGRRKVFHLLGVISIACSFFFIWHQCIGCQNTPYTYQVIYFASVAILFQFGWASTAIAQLSLIPELTKDKHVKVELTSLRYTFTILANIVVFGCFWALLAKLNKSVDSTHLTSDDKDIFWIMALVVIGLGVGVAMFFQIFVHEDPNAKQAKLRWYRWFAQPQFYLVACAFVTSRIIVIIPQTYIPLYFTETLHMDKTSIAKGPMVIYITSFFITLIMKKFSKIIGDKMTFFLGLSAVWGALIWFWVKDPTHDSTSAFNFSRDTVYGATVLLGAGGAILIVIAMSMIAYTVGDFTGSSAFVYGWMYFADRLSNGVIVKIIQQFTPESNDRLPEFYRNVLVYLPFAATGLGVLTLLLMLLHERLKKSCMPVHDSVPVSVAESRGCLHSAYRRMREVL